MQVRQPSPTLLLLLLAACCRLAQQQCQNQQPSQEGPCVNVSTVEECGQLSPFSFFPNNITNSFENALSLHISYEPFYRGCSDYLQAHLCIALFPVCSDAGPDGSRFKPPCRNLCSKVRSDCGDRVQVVQDPSCLLYECDRYPDTDCVGVDDPIVVATLPVVTPSQRPRTNRSNASEPTNATSSACPPPSLSFFSDEAKTFAKGWVAFWSVVCYLSTLVTLLTFFLDTSRFQYPWRPVVYLALSFHVHTLGYFLALIIGRDSVTCPGGEYVQTEGKWTWAHTPCILVFGLLYYSMMAAFLWWLVLTLSWFLSSAYKWSNEAISQFALFYHTAAWILPLIMTVSLLAARVVSADELSATCFIVRTDTRTSFLALLLGLIIPLSVLLFIGTLFLLIGFIGLLQIRRFMVHRGKERESVILEKLMIRIGVFVAIYIIPAAVLIACFIYEIHSRPSWSPIGEDCPTCSTPNTAVFMVRVFMFLLIGALTGIWIWSKKTLTSWRNLPQKLWHCVLQRKTTDTGEELQEPRRQNSFHSALPPTTSGYPYLDSGTEFTA